MSDTDDDRDPKTGQFVTGSKGGPGRRKGSRNKLGEQFLSDLQADWSEHGADTLIKAREEKPMEYAKMVAGLLPKELLVRTAPEDDMTDDELADTLEHLERLAAHIRASGDVSASDSESSSKKARLQ